MAKFFEVLGNEHRRFIGKQKIFFTATAPEEGRVNLSPKGMDTFRCIDERTVCYLDLTGSGNESAAHLRQNGRMTIMFCSFDRKPLILRLYGRGEVITRTDGVWGDYHAHLPYLPGERQIIALHVESVQTSCGYAVPIYAFEEERPTLVEWSEKKGEAGLRQYWQQENTTSIDSLPTGIVLDENAPVRG